MAYRPRLAAVGRPTTRSPPGPWARSRCLVEYAAPLLREGGILVAWKGARDAAEEAAGAAAAEQVGMAVGDVLPVKPFATSENRHLHVVRKISPTPAGFPRRPGMARKRPLG